jgi:signal transduction histidine kinase
MKTNGRRFGVKCAITFVFVCAVVWLVPLPAYGQSSATKKVLVLYWDAKDVPGNVSFDQGFQAGMQSEPSRWELYSEYLDSARFPGEHQNQLLHDYLREKYVDKKIDVVVASPDPSLEFLLKYRTDLFPTCPIVFAAVKRPDPGLLTAGPGLTGIIRANTHRKTVDLALKLHPGTEHLFVISGTPERDKRFEIAAREELAGYESKLDIQYLTDLPINELVEKAKNFPSRSIVLYAWQRSDTAGEKVLQTYDVLALIAKSCSAPIYGMGSRNVGHGIVGGYVQDSERNGLEIAECVRRILNGTRAQDIPVDSAASVLMFDWRELQRWRIDERSLPNGSIIKFKELTLWQQYKWRITGVLLLFFLQSSIIGLLLIERKRRQRAKEALAQLNTELEQRITARTAALNAKSKELETFAYSVAHDLKAPLRGIEGYSRLLLEEHTANLNEEARTFVKTIRSSSEEMDQLIEDLLDYSRMERRELKTDRIELRTFVNSVVDQKKVEAAARGVDITIDVNGGFVHGDLNGLSQALKNYLDNAIKFSKGSADPRIEIGADETERSCRLWVRDNGLGFDMKYKDRIFDIFERLNRSEDYPGTGIGLAIVRRAMERMGGKAWGEGEPGRGAKFYLEIPK